MKKPFYFFGCALISLHANAGLIKLDVDMKYSKAGEIAKAVKSEFQVKLGEKVRVENEVMLGEFTINKFEGELPDVDPEKLKDSFLIQGKMFVKEEGKLRQIATPEVVTFKGKQAMFTTQDENGETVEIEIDSKYLQ